MKTKNILGYIKNINEYLICRNKNLCFYNFWPYSKVSYYDMWFYRFIENRKIFPEKSKNKLLFYSVLGEKRLISLSNKYPKIFYTGENTQWMFGNGYNDHCLDLVDLSLGFEYISNPKYLRFPLWIMHNNFIPPEINYDNLKVLVNKLSHSNYDENEKNKFCALIARHDFGGQRKKILDQVSIIDKVDCAGLFANNSTELKAKFNDDKVTFLSKYKFNISIENSNMNGYVTEKIFESIKGTCIPIYWGSCNNPEPEVLNSNAILFWNPDENNENLLKSLKLLQNNQNAYKDFFSQPKFKPNAADVIWEKLNDLESSLRNLLKE